jgi:hypothetical protein
MRTPARQLSVSAFTMLFVVVGLSFRPSVDWLVLDQEYAKTDGMLGKSSQDVVAALGDPTEVYNKKRFWERDRWGHFRGWDPDPSYPIGERAFCYVIGTKRVVFYFANDVVTAVKASYS